MRINDCGIGISMLVDLAPTEAEVEEMKDGTSRSSLV